jgi:hypothetical protein
VVYRPHRWYEKLVPLYKKGRASFFKSDVIIELQDQEDEFFFEDDEQPSENLGASKVRQSIPIALKGGAKSLT